MPANFLICLFLFGTVIFSETGPEPDVTNFKHTQEAFEEILIDADYTLDEALAGIEIPGWIRNELTLVNVEYYSFDDKLHRGQIVIHKVLAKDIEAIFELIKEKQFPIAKVIPIVKYNWSDEKSMLDNNTSAFNYRVVKGTNRLSNHAYGRAIDINPFQNFCIKNKYVSPKSSSYNPNKPGTITEDSFLVKEFKKRGWTWGGDWKTLKDYQHFEKKSGK